MRRFRRVLAFVLLAISAGTTLIAQEHAPLTLTRLYTGSDALSHFERMQVEFAPVAGAMVTRAESEPVSLTKGYFLQLAPGFFQDWHNADVRRYVITISGRAEIEVAGGQKFVAEPGNVVLAEDLTGKGHTFRVVGDSDWVAMFVDIGK